MSKPSLAEANPELSKEWHPTKNGELTPGDVTFHSGKKVWWKCDKADDHEWKATINSRSSSIANCPCCRGFKVVLSNCLSTVNPHLSNEWHTTKNGTLTPFDVVSGSNKKVWWKCDKGDDHQWEAKINDRSNGRGCPYCRGRKIVLSNCLQTTHPTLSKQWHPTKNGNLSPLHVSKGLAKRIWWKCDKGDDHEWISTISNRAIKGKGCPICSGRQVNLTNCLATTNPKIAKEWHPTKNGNLTPFDVVNGSGKIVWWKCDKADDHEWMAKVGSRTSSNSTDCPCCCHRKVVLSNCLATTNPKLAKEWHCNKNGDLTPHDVTNESQKKVWWKCSKGEDHEWETTIASRSNGRGCPVCKGKKVVRSNCLATINPDLAKEWHPSKNQDLTANDVTIYSHKKVWWKCDKGDDHEWETRVAKRSMAQGCPYCTLTPQSRQELIITFELKKIFVDINPKGFKTVLDGRLRAIDIFIPLLNLAIEFDGSFWHKDKKSLDKIKSEMLMDEGYKVIRIREEPLKKIHENDIISPHPYNGKQITDNILKRIQELYDLDSKAKNKIEVYLQKDSLQNEKGLDRYIDQILTEKAEKREQLH